jgi:WD40-like Beta Propeller Repeat
MINCPIKIVSILAATVIFFHSTSGLGVVKQSLVTQDQGQGQDKIKVPMPKSWLRLDTGMTHIRPNINAKFIAFVPEGKLGLRVLNVTSGKIVEASENFIGSSSFWSPDGARLFYRELLRADNKTTSRIRAWDVVQNRNVEVDSFEGPSGFLSFDPRDNRMLLMYNKGIKNKKLVFPDNRLARWQAGQHRDSGRWVMAQKGATFVTEAGFAMQKLKDDDSGIESFDISPDGTSAAWATKAGRIYVSKNGEAPEMLDWGRDPKWHPDKFLLVYAGGRMVGNKAADYDLKIGTPGTTGSFLTATQQTAERWPAWNPDGNSIFYTVDGSKELSVLSFSPSQPQTSEVKFPNQHEVR